MLLCVSAFAANVVYLAGGVGIPELVHAEVGGFPHPRVAVEAQVGWTLFNPMVGLGVEGAVWTSTGGTEGHAFTAMVEGRLNPTVEPLSITSYGETLAASAGAYAGYRWMGEEGLFVRVRAGAIFYKDNGFGAGPNVTAGVGYAF